MAAFPANVPPNDCSIKRYFTLILNVTLKYFLSTVNCMTIHVMLNVNGALIMTCVEF